MPCKRSSQPAGARAIALALCVAVTLLTGMRAHAQAYPARPVKVIVPFAPGGFTDSVIRSFAVKLGERLKQSVVIDNRPGASGNIGTALAAQSPADGYTLLAAFDGTLMINPHLQDKVPFDPLKDFVPITNLGMSGAVIAVHPSVPVDDLRGLVAMLKAKPNSLAFSSAGAGSTGHLMVEMFKKQAGIEMEHVAYKGGGSAITDVLAGHVPAISTAVSTLAQYVKQGKLKALAISSARRDPAMPNVPTFIESGYPNFSVTSWIGLAAPAGTPRAIIEKIYHESVLALQSPEVREQYLQLGIEPIGNTPEQFGEQMKADYARWGAVVRTTRVSKD